MWLWRHTKLEKNGKNNFSRLMQTQEGFVCKYLLFFSLRWCHAVKNTNRKTNFKRNNKKKRFPKGATYRVCENCGPILVLRSINKINVHTWKLVVKFRNDTISVIKFDVWSYRQILIIWDFMENDKTHM